MQLDPRIVTLGVIVLAFGVVLLALTYLAEYLIPLALIAVVAVIAYDVFRR